MKLIRLGGQWEHPNYKGRSKSSWTPLIKYVLVKVKPKITIVLEVVPLHCLAPVPPCFPRWKIFLNAVSVTA